MLKVRLNFKKVFAATIFLTGFSIGNTMAQTATTDEGVVIDGIKWATRNVDAPGTFSSAPEKGGMFYQWNKQEGWSITDPRVDSNGNTYWYAHKVEPEDEWTDKDPCPVGWRVPTEVELRSLNSVGSTWTKRSGVLGRLFGTAPDQIFLPAVGYRSRSDGTYSASENGSYWSSTRYYLYSSTNSSWMYWYLFFYSSDVRMTTGHPAAGFCVRCVADDTTGVNDISLDTETATIVGYFDILGRKLKVEPIKGLYIIQYDSGKSKKMMK